jgi:hypothetical protein
MARVTGLENFYGFYDVVYATRPSNYRSMVAVSLPRAIAAPAIAIQAVFALVPPGRESFLSRA